LSAGPPPPPSRRSREIVNRAGCQRQLNFDPLAAMPRRGQYSPAADTGPGDPGAARPRQNRFHVICVTTAPEPRRMMAVWQGVKASKTASRRARARD
jgi:hypothetical protein